MFHGYWRSGISAKLTPLLTLVSTFLNQSWSLTLTFNYFKFWNLFPSINLWKIHFFVVNAAECGDYVAEDYPDHTYLSTYKFIPTQDAELERRIMENHKKHV